MVGGVAGGADGGWPGVRSGRAIGIGRGVGAIRTLLALLPGRGITCTLVGWGGGGLTSGGWPDLGLPRPLNLGLGAGASVPGSSGGLLVGLPAGRPDGS